MNKYKIGANAGTVWATLEARRGKMTFSELIPATQLTPLELAAAIGWLAREDKIHFVDEGGKTFVFVYQECYY